MAIYTPGMGSAQSVGQLPVEKTAYDTKNRMMQMDMMGMRSKAMADAALKARKAQEEKDLWNIKSADADYFQEAYNTQDVFPAQRQMLTEYQKGTLNEPKKFQIMSGLQEKAAQYKTLAEESRKAVNNALVGMEKVYDPGALLGSVKEKQFAKIRAGQPYSQTEIQADVEAAKKELKSLQQGNINQAFVKTANERKNAVNVVSDPTGLYKTGNKAEAQAYWKLNPKSGRVEGFDFDAFYNDYTQPGSTTQQLYAANKADKLSDPNAKKRYDDLVTKLNTRYASDPQTLQKKIRKLDAEEFILPYFGQGNDWDTYFAKNETREGIRQFVKPTSDELEQEDAAKLGSLETKAVLQTSSFGTAGTQGGYQTVVGGVLTKPQAQNLKPDRYGRAVPGKVQNISAGADQSFEFNGRVNLNPEGLVLKKNGKIVPISATSMNRVDYNFFKNNGLIGKNGNFMAGQELSIPVAKNFIDFAKRNGFTVEAKGRSGNYVPVGDIKDLADVPGLLVPSVYYKITVAEGQEKQQGKPTTSFTGTDASGNPIVTQGGVNITIGGPGTPKELLYSVNVPSSINNMVERNIGKKKKVETIDQIKKSVMNTIFSALQGEMGTTQGGQQSTGNQSQVIDFESGE
jgi:hypothetical protein